jgi:hypothetical protein
MSRECKVEHCYVPETACHLGEEDWKACPNWQAMADQKPDAQSRGATDAVLLPWTGNSLGSVDLPFLTGRSNPAIVGIVGAQKAGKTTLLAAWYLLLGKGMKVREHLCAGSYTFQGWENIAHSLRWEGHDGPTFPLHTSSGGGRLPGILHLAFRRNNSLASDILFADAPGEWFTRWAINRDAPDAVGARWVAEFSKVFLVVADCESLAGEARGRARSSLQLLLQRLAAERLQRPVALVWSKSDIEVPKDIREAVTETAHRMIPGLTEFSVSVHPLSESASTVRSQHMELLEWALTQPQGGFKEFRAPITSRDPFFVYGRV